MPYFFIIPLFALGYGILVLLTILLFCWRPARTLAWYLVGGLGGILGGVVLANLVYFLLFLLGLGIIKEIGPTPFPLDSANSVWQLSQFLGFLLGMLAGPVLATGVGLVGGLLAGLVATLLIRWLWQRPKRDSGG